MRLNNKVLINCGMLKPIWVYGIELWGTCTKSKGAKQHTEGNHKRVLVHTTTNSLNTLIC